MSKRRLLAVRCGNLKDQQHINTLLLYLAESGEYEVTLLSISSEVDVEAWSQAALPGILVVRPETKTRIKPLRWMILGIKIARWIKKNPPDLLYMIDSWTLPYMMVATKAMTGLRRIPKVYHTFDMLVNGVAPALYIWIERFVARRVALNVNTDECRAVITKNWFGLKTTPLHIPLRESKKTELPRRDMEFRRQILQDCFQCRDGIIFVYPCRCTGPGRGIEQLLAAFAKLPSEFLLLTIDGGNDYCRNLQQQCRERGLDKRVVFLPPMPHAELMRYVAIADVGGVFHDPDVSLGNFFCHSSRLAYYVSLGIPCLATEVPSQDAVVYRYGLGKSCDVKDPDAIAGALLTMQREEFFGEEKREMIRRQFLSTFHYEIRAKRLLSALKSLES